MAYLVNVTDRALRDLSMIYRRIEASSSAQAARWFDGLEKAIFSLEAYPNRGTLAPEDATVRQLLYGRKPHVYRIVYEIEEETSTVTVLHIRPPGRDKMETR